MKKSEFLRNNFIFLQFVISISMMVSYLKKTISVIAAILFPGAVCGYLAAQDTDSLLYRADSLRKAYLFSESVSLYDRILSMTEDSLSRIAVQDSKMLSENGLGMTDFVYQPTVVARHRFSMEDFYLYYPLEDKSWRPLPNVFDTVGKHPFYKAVYFPENSRTLYYSAPDQDGSVNIYTTEKKDTVWSTPCLLNEYLVSSADEIYPMLSPDGKHLYFASSGLYGMGGYDLYVSTWNEDQKEWGPPSNMGMPFSSPYNDFLFINTEDGKYSIFASDRACAGDSVDVYVLKQESMPVRKGINDIGQLRHVMALDPVDDLSAFDSGKAISQIVPDDIDTREYTAKVEEVRTLKDSIYYYTVESDCKKARIEETSDTSDIKRMREIISRNESRIPVLRNALAAASAELQKIEMDFLFRGIVLDPDQLMKEADRKVEGESSNYVFARMVPGDVPDIVLEKPKEKFDYTFQILPTARFAENNDLPDGIVYQIQLFNLNARPEISLLKGLSPVFEELTPAGRYIYRAGLFRSYNDALSHINKVKKLGFRTAFIAAFHDGEAIPVNKARGLEKQYRESALYQIYVVPFDDRLSELTISAIEQLGGKKDIARTVKDGKTVYIIGNFDDKSLVDRVIVAVKATDVADVYSVRLGPDEAKR